MKKTDFPLGTAYGIASTIAFQVKKWALKGVLYPESIANVIGNICLVSNLSIIDLSCVLS
ncbi:hypothetical protein [Streptococcus pyogenes]|uniref:hypothetical protein n=1 Tax=Streptococcus pyogenes TaxID=1314 RepID=UPI00115D72A5|nr:hypothetical protein [Streptococcus pyogenes]